MNIKVDWKKLNDFNEVITSRLMKRLPSDWKLSRDEVKSEVNETFIKLIKLFVPKLDGMSLTTYCYKYAEKITYSRLKNEYERLKKQISFEDAFADKYDEEDDIYHISKFYRQYGYYDIMPYTTIDETIEKNDLINEIIKILDPIDKQIAKMILINDLSQKQIASKLKMTPANISYRLKKLRQTINFK